MEGEGICHYTSVIKTCQKLEKNEKKKILTENEKHLVFSFPSLRMKKKSLPGLVPLGLEPRTFCV